jgi:hypothetical protein
MMNPIFYIYDMYVGLDRFNLTWTGPIASVRFDSVSNRSVSVGLGPVQTEVEHP